MSAFPNPPHEPNAAEVLRNMLSFGFSLLSPNDQQDKIEQISEKLAAGVADVERLEGETEEDLRRKQFAELLNKAPVHTQKWDLDALLIQASGNEEIEEIKQSRYAEYYLGLSIIWFKARRASDPEDLIHLIISKVGEGDHIIEKLVNETEEDFRLRRFTESFKQLQFSSQEDVVKHIRDIVLNDPGLPIPQCLSAHVTKELALEFIKLKIPNLRVSGGAAATQGGGQGAITQGGQGTSQQ
ncbi:hypothetical protein L3X38_039236 [Prunus dulcis]|uniref:Uncharacterized protein n=1 Tax=Prunus dulcis TaxID=3755 RepID=A0AAD4V7U7_PRUDU|nr:hypothetical protein L3X38_039236 [Prunus dulcis]